MGHHVLVVDLGFFSSFQLNLIGVGHQGFCRPSKNLLGIPNELDSSGASSLFRPSKNLLGILNELDSSG